MLTLELASITGWSELELREKIPHGRLSVYKALVPWIRARQRSELARVALLGQFVPKDRNYANQFFRQLQRDLTVKLKPTGPVDSSKYDATWNRLRRMKRG